MPSLLPSLLERLDHPGETLTGQRRGDSEQQLIGAVLRNVAWLLNHTHLEALEPSVADFPLARASVLNYGIRPLTGRITGDTWESTLVDSIRQALQRFEPRLRHTRVSVRKETSGASQSVEPTRSVVEVTIEATLHTPSFEVPLRLVGRLDPDAGRVSLEAGG